MLKAQRFSVLVLFALIVLTACQSPPPERGTWSGSVSIGAGRTIPFRMSLDLATDPPSGAFLVGEERTVIPEIRIAGDSLILAISEYKAALRGVWNGKHIEGQYERYRADTTTIPFTAWPETAEPDVEAQPHSEGATGVRLSGNYRVYQAGATDIDSSASAIFRVKGDSVFGTIIEPSGDYGLFAGTQQGSTVVLNRFTGWQVQQLELHSRGTEWQALSYVRTLEPVVLTLRPIAAELPIVPEGSATTMKDPAARFAFWGFTPEGDTVRHSDGRFSGKVLVLDIMGTWCHNCLDAAPVLQQLYDEYRDRGLEVIGLAFELADDPALARKNLSLYRQRHGIRFPLLFCGSLDPANIQMRIRSQLHGFGAYPTTLFVGRDGRVRSIHMGFTGPGTGDLYQAQVASYFREVESLLNEQGPPTPRDARLPSRQ